MPPPPWHCQLHYPKANKFLNEIYSTTQNITSDWLPVSFQFFFLDFFKNALRYICIIFCTNVHYMRTVSCPDRNLMCLCNTASNIWPMIYTHPCEFGQILSFNLMWKKYHLCKICFVTNNEDSSYSLSNQLCNKHATSLWPVLSAGCSHAQVCFVCLSELALEKTELTAVKMANQSAELM